MQIEVSSLTVDLVAIALIWCLVCVGSGRVLGHWFTIRENRRREREQDRRDRQERRESRLRRHWDVKSLLDKDDDATETDKS